MLSNHILSVFALSSLIALIGCSDKTPVEETNKTTTPEAVTSTKVATADSTTITEPELVVETVEVVEVDENPPRFAKVTDYFTLKSNTNWSWKSLANTPDINEWYSKTPSANGQASESPNYYISGGLDDYGGMVTYGTKEQPVIITIGSSQAITDEETSAAVYKLEDLFKPSELNRVKSNCDKGENELFSQHFYKWEKPGHQPLYIYSIIDQANAGKSSDVGIAKSLDLFFDSEYSDDLQNLSSYDAEGNGVTCTFNLV